MVQKLTDISKKKMSQKIIKLTSPDIKHYPYLTFTLPYGADVLPPNAEASNGPNAHPQINRKVTKSPSAVLTWVPTKTWNHHHQVKAYSFWPAR